MIYTEAMKDYLRAQDEEVSTLMTYYLDNFLKTRRHPKFDTQELRKVWFLLITDGLLNEVRLRTKNWAIAKNELIKILDKNSAFYRNNTFIVKNM